MISRFRAMWDQRRLDEDLRREAESHLELLEEEYLRRGMTPTEARRAARLQFGGVTQLVEAQRDARGFRRWTLFFRTYVSRCAWLRKNPGLTAVAVAALALGIGATNTMFTILNGMVLRGLRWTSPTASYPFTAWSCARIIWCRRWSTCRRNRLRQRLMEQTHQALGEVDVVVAPHGVWWHPSQGLNALTSFTGHPGVSVLIGLRSNGQPLAVTLAGASLSGGGASGGGPASAGSDGVRRPPAAAVLVKPAASS